MKCKYRTLLAATVMLASTACTVATRVVDEPQATQGVHEQSARITEAAIEDDIAYINSLRQRLGMLNAAGLSIEDYQLCKAQAWVDMAFDEYTDNDRSAVVEASLQQAEMIITGLEQGLEISMATPVIATSKYLRDDLWASAEAVKSSPSFACSACGVARLEVQLVWVGHETNELGWRHASSEIMAAERIERDIRDSAARCEGLEETQLQLPDRLHFSHDSSVISPQSAALLTRISEYMHTDGKIRLQLEGFADETGSTDYNLALSLRRAIAEREFLLKKDIAPERLTLRTLGELDPVKKKAGSGRRLRSTAAWNCCSLARITLAWKTCTRIFNHRKHDEKQETHHSYDATSIVCGPDN